MKKYLKKVYILCLISLCIVNPIRAAIISDNDGSAFVTKFEFEAMKNNFKNQIDNYEDSIDGKVDGAVSAYLAGIKLETVSNEKMLHYDWTNIEFVNYEIKPEFKVPDYTWWVTAGWFSTGSASGAPDFDKKLANVCGFKKYIRNWGSDETCIRPMAKLLYGNETNVGTVAWAGCAARWAETWKINKIAWGSAPNMAGVSYYRVNLYHPFSFLVEGNVKDKTITELLMARMDFDASSDGTTWITATRNASNVQERLPYAYEGGNYAFSVSLGNLSDGNDIVHDHIFVENGTSTKMWLSVDNFINTINNCDYQTLTDQSFGTVSGVTTKVTGSRLTYIDKKNYVTGYIGDIIWDYENCKMPLVGLLPTHYYCRDIYQEAYNVDTSQNVLNRSLSWGGKTINNAPPLTLENGLEVCISDVEKEYEWEINFDNVTIYKDSSEEVNQHEVDVYLSTVPFGDGVTTEEPLKVKVNDVKKDFFTTEGRKGKFRWEVDGAKIIYMKCVPHWKSTDTQSENYYIRLSDEAKNIAVIS